MFKNTVHFPPLTGAETEKENEQTAVLDFPQLCLQQSIFKFQKANLF